MTQTNAFQNGTMVTPLAKKNCTRVDRTRSPVVAPTWKFSGAT